WWWHDLRVERTEIVRELDMLAEAGFGGVEINALSFPRHDTPHPSLPPALRYGSHEHWEIVAFAASEARERGMIADMLVGAGWPFAAEWVPHEHRVQGVAVVPVDVEVAADHETVRVHAFAADDAVTAAYRARECSACEVLFAVAVPAGCNGLGDMARLEASLETTDEGPVAGLTVPRGSWEIRVGFRLQGDCFKVNIEGVEGGMGHVVDHYNAEAVRSFLDRSSDSYRETIGEPMGERLRALFVDSIEVGGANWAPGAREAFRSRHGYDIDPFLPFVFTTGHQQYGEPPFTDAAERARVSRARQNFNETLVELFENRSVKTVAEWAHDQGCLFRYQAYGMPHYLGVAQGARHADIPESENWVYNPHTDRAYRSKLVDAAVHIAGREIHSSESVTSARGGFKASLSDIRSLCDYQALAGVTHPVVHGVGYCPPGVPFPGHARFPTYFNERNPWWPHVRLWSDYQSRLDAVLQACRSTAQVAIVLPEADAWAERGLGISAITRPTPYHAQLWEAFQSYGYTADYVPDTMLAEAALGAGAEPVLRCGEADYRAIVIPELTRLHAPTASLVAEAARAGIPVIVVGEAPRLGRTDADDDATRAAVTAFAGAALHLPPPAEGDDLVRWLAPVVPELPPPPVVVSSPAPGVLVRAWDGGPVTVVHVARVHQPGVALYPGDEETIGVTVETGARSCVELDPASGAVRELGSGSIRFELVKRESRLLLLTDEPQEALAAAGRGAETVRATVAGPWQAIFTWPDGRTESRTLESLGDLARRSDELADFSGVYRLTTTVETDTAARARARDRPGRAPRACEGAVERPRPRGGLAPAVPARPSGRGRRRAERARNRDHDHALELVPHAHRQRAGHVLGTLVELARAARPDPRPRAFRARGSGYAARVRRASGGRRRRAEGASGSSARTALRQSISMPPLMSIVEPVM
ncbi:MAG: glycosyl hydrolase, partial [Spirochaetota bacterium]